MISADHSGFVRVCGEVRHAGSRFAGMVSAMDGVWHRLSVYWGLREDAELTARWEAARPDPVTRVLGLAPLVVIVLAAWSGAFVLLIRWLQSRDIGVADIIWGSLNVVNVAVVLALFAAGIARWVFWFRDRRRR